MTYSVEVEQDASSSKIKANENCLSAKTLESASFSYVPRIMNSTVPASTVSSQTNVKLPYADIIT